MWAPGSMAFLPSLADWLAGSRQVGRPGARCPVAVVRRWGAGAPGDSGVVSRAPTSQIAVGVRGQRLAPCCKRCAASVPAQGAGVRLSVYGACVRACWHRAVAWGFEAVWLQGLPPCEVYLSHCSSLRFTSMHKPAASGHRARRPVGRPVGGPSERAERERRGHAAASHQPCMQYNASSLRGAAPLQTLPPTPWSTHRRRRTCWASR